MMSAARAVTPSATVPSCTSTVIEAGSTVVAGAVVPGADAPEGVDAWGVLAIGAELLALAAAVGLLRRRARIADPA